MTHWSLRPLDSRTTQPLARFVRMCILPQESSGMRVSGISAYCGMSALLLIVGLSNVACAQEPTKPPSTSEAGLKLDTVKPFITQHCTSCHNNTGKKGGLALDTVSAKDVASNPDVWEKVVRKLASREMPPVGRPRPDERA